MLDIERTDEETFEFLESVRGDKNKTLKTFARVFDSERFGCILIQKSAHKNSPAINVKYISGNDTFVNGTVDYPVDGSLPAAVWTRDLHFHTCTLEEIEDFVSTVVDYEIEAMMNGEEFGGDY